MIKDNQIGQKCKELLTEREGQDIESQIAEAGQIVRAIGRIDSREAFSQVQSRVQRQKNRTRFVHLLTRVAAVLFVPVLITSILFFYNLGQQSVTGQFAMQQISSPPGVRSEIVLPDGSKVWLNAESTISYPVPFNSNGRHVQLTGEAFFQVKKDERNPFRVESGKVNVTVLGTRFNVKAFPGDETTEVTLEEGKVKLNSTGYETGQEIELRPGERAVINKKSNSVRISAGNIEKYIGWREGKLIFDNSPLSEVAQSLERWYGVEVQIADPEILTCQISSTFENESLHQVLALLELASPIKVSLIPARVGETSQTRSKEKVIITSKN